MITRQELLSFLSQQWQCEVSPVDSEYSLVTRHWLETQLIPAMDATCQSLGLSYQDDRWDCEDYAALFVMLAKLKRETAHSIAIGWLFYSAQIEPNITGNHGIGFAVLREEGKLVVVYIEPQPPAHIVRLTKEEELSVYHNRV